MNKRTRNVAGIVVLLALVSFAGAKSSGEHVDKREINAVVAVENFENDPYKAQLISSLSKLNDIIVLDVDYSDEVAIAVGEDNSAQTREAAGRDEYHKGVMLYSFDRGKSWQRSYWDDIPIADVRLIKGKKAIACGSMAGSGGTIIMTDDGGKRWKAVYTGDTVNGVTVYKNTLFSAGFSIMKSRDGTVWERIYSSERELYAIKSVGGKRLIAAGDGLILYSDDSAKHWHKANLVGDASVQWARKIFQKKGKLYVVTEGGDYTLLVSTDNGLSWQAEKREKE